MPWGFPCVILLSTITGHVDNIKSLYSSGSFSLEVAEMQLLINLTRTKRGIYWLSTLRSSMVKLALVSAGSRSSTQVFRDLLYLLVLCLLRWVHFWVSVPYIGQVLPLWWQRWLLTNPSLYPINLATQIEKECLVVFWALVQGLAVIGRCCLGHLPIYEPIIMTPGWWLWDVRECVCGGDYSLPPGSHNLKMGQGSSPEENLVLLARKGRMAAKTNVHCSHQENVVLKIFFAKKQKI